MRRRLYGQPDERQHGGDPFVWINVPAIVAENVDPEHRHRIRVIVPAIDEIQILDDWIEQLSPYAGSRGYGDISVPAINSEVRLFGEFGQAERLQSIVSCLGAF